MIRPRGPEGEWEPAGAQRRSCSTNDGLNLSLDETVFLRFPRCRSVVFDAQLSARIYELIGSVREHVTDFFDKGAFLLASKIVVTPT